MQSILFWSAVTLYALSTVAWFAWAAFRKEWGASAGRALLALGLLPHAASLALRWIEVGHGPYNTRYEVISADTFIVVAVWLVATLVARGLRGLGVFVAPSAFLLMGWAVSTFELKREVPIIFKSWWLFLHIGFAKLFFAAILLAAACAAAWLVKDRNPKALSSLPSPEKLDLYAHQFMLISFLFLGVMIAAGALWAHQSWGRYWGWDPIETSALVTWIVFGIVLHFRVLHRWSGRRMAWLTFVALAFSVVTLFVVAILVPTIHNSYMVGELMRRLVLASLLLLAACPGASAEAAKAVREYDEALVRAYARGDASPLANLATAKEMGRVQVLVDLKTAGKLVLESKLEAFEVTSTATSGDTATVETRERWRYHDRHTKPGEPDGPDFVAEMRMRYALVREGGRWKVGSVSTLANEYLEPKGGKPGGAHGQGASHGPEGKTGGQQ